MADQSLADDDAERVQAKNGQPPATDPLDAGMVARRRSRTRLRNLVLGAVIGSVIGLVGTIGVMVYFNRGQLPIMTPTEFEAAVSRWNERGPKSYDMDLEGNFDIKGKLHVEVRNGDVTAMSLDRQPSPARIWEYWSVSGLFGVVRRDLDRNQAAAKNPGGSLPQPVLQQAEFDPDLGFPRRYQRTEISSGQSGDWRIVSLRRAD
jgi:Family of unknown function (DUF6174)